MLDKSLIPGRGRGFFAYGREDIPAGVVVFFVALPLCLGVAQASSAPPIAGLLAGIVGGLLVPWVSQSALSVAGPAAGLTVLVAAGIQTLGFRGYLVATMIAGMLQILLGILRMGVIAHFLPSSVVHGMLAAIGLLIILKQLPHAVGYDHDFEGDEAFNEGSGHNTFTEIFDSLQAITPAAVVVSALGIGVAILAPRLVKSMPRLNLVPVPLMVVLVGIAGALAVRTLAGLELGPEHLVRLPISGGASEWSKLLTTPDFSLIGDPRVWTAGATLAAVASIESLLSLEAVDGMDPHRRISPPNRELIAQGLGNIFAGLIGGLPVTSVIVRSSANVQAGGKTKLSALVHGALLLFGLLALPWALNQIPLAALAIVLILTGIKLNRLELWKSQWKLGPDRFVPFIVTILGILFLDLLRGTLLGGAVGLGFMVWAEQKNAIIVTRDGDHVLITFVKDVTFLQKPRLKSILHAVEPDMTVIVDRRAIAFVDPDVVEVLDNFKRDSAHRGITFRQFLEPAGAAQSRRDSIHSIAPRTSVRP